MTQPGEAPRAGARARLAFLARHPSVQATTILALSLAPIFVVPKASPIIAAVAAEGLAVVSPLIGIGQRRFWRYQLASVLCQFTLLMAYFVICDRLTGGLGDDAMIFLLPFMTPLFAIPLATILWLGLRLRRRSSPT